MVLLIFFVLGLIFGSFINALVWRLHAKKDWVKERSMCPSCKHTLAAKDLVPVLSWLSLRGKCRYCKKPIPDSPLVELLTASLFVISYNYWPYDLTLLGILGLASWLLCLVVLIALLIYDLKWMLLPNKLVLLATGFSALNVILIAAMLGRSSYVLEAILGAVVIAGLFWGLFEASKGKWIGGGDVKLAVALGLLAGSPVKSILLIFIASVLGTLFSLPLLLSKKLTKSAKIPFGPLLILATIVVYLFGQQLIDWYTSKILY